MKDLSIVIPAYNEAARLPATLADVLDFARARRLELEIIVVSDGSRDRTNALVADLAARDGRLRLLVNPTNRGKGYSVRRGMLAAEGERLLFMDADNSTRVGELDRFLPLLAEFDVVIGSRALPGARIVLHQPWLRERTGRLFNFFIRTFFLKEFKDTQCGFKLFRRAAARAIFERATIDGFVFDVEILLLARRLGYKITELPVTWENSKPSKVAFWRGFARITFDLLNLLLNKPNRA